MSENVKQSQIQDTFRALLNSIERYANSKTIVGEALQFGSVIIIPLVEVFFGAGAGETGGMGGGGGLGAKISPSAVLVVVNDTVQLVNVKNQDSVNKLIDLVPGIMSKLSGFFEKKEDKPRKVSINV